MKKKININIDQIDNQLLAVSLYIVILMFIIVSLKSFKIFFIKVLSWIPYEWFKLLILFWLQYVILLWILCLVFRKVLHSDIKVYFLKQFKRISFKSILYILFIYLLTIILIWFIKLLFYYLNLDIPWFGYKEQVVDFVQVFIEKANLLDIVLLFLIVVFIWPLVEEIIFRWFITKILIEKLGSILWIFIWALIFSFFHFEWEVMGYLFILWVVLNYIYYKYRSLTHSLLFHFVVNFVTFLLLLI